ncbi:hypothetical protein FH972_019184 [Carpinus fangiana]|uniref:Uncharacterized protein n=1 Tax=Carpinus fangiana TaxID=176857 RepID=A0A5N6RPN4_9ROSI|nr:hypothetical protein FH972_019184 [Carpinus fangiana]
MSSSQGFGVIERGVVQSDLLIEHFRFIYDIFRDNQWTSLFTPVDAYLRLVREFYFNIESIKKTHELSFKTKVLGKTLTINSALISEVTRIPLTNGKAAPLLHTEPQPSKADIMAVLNPGGELEWEDNKSKISIGHVRAPKRVPFCLCSHFLLIMLDLYEEHSIALPYEGDHAPPIIPDPQVVSSSGSSVSDVSTQLNEIIGLLRSQELGIAALNNRLRVIEKDVQQVKVALRHILPEYQWDLNP